MRVDSSLLLISMIWLFIVFVKDLICDGKSEVYLKTLS